jgi:hypothetical protein
LKKFKFDFNRKYPTCSTAFKSLEELTYHLVDMHFGALGGNQAEIQASWGASSLTPFLWFFSTYR